jgi:rhamnogalacturonan endolyase
MAMHALKRRTGAAWIVAAALAGCGGGGGTGTPAAAETSVTAPVAIPVTTAPGTVAVTPETPAVPVSSTPETVPATGPATVPPTAPATTPSITPVVPVVTAPVTPVLPIPASFGASTASGLITVNSGAGLVFKVNATNGDIKSIRYNGGPEMQYWEKGSHIASGLGSAQTSVAYTVVDGIVKVAITTPTLTHYLLVRAGDNTIYMGTYITAEPGVGELRWITRFDAATLPNRPGPSDLAGNIGFIESEDVFGLAGGESRSKYFGNQRAIDLTLRGATGTGVGVFMVYGNRESSSGGPFYNDIQNQTTEIYNYMNSGHNQTEAVRVGFHGPYALVFTDGATPAIPDMAWMESQNLLGWVPAAARGSVSGAGLSGMNSAYPYVVGFANATAQYWARATPGTGAFTAPHMKPGTYKMTVYKNEYAVLTDSVDVVAGKDTAIGTRAIAADPSTATALWRIGDWDGTPNEFLNGPRLRTMHPSDVRQTTWVRPPYIVGTSTPADDFSPYQFRAINGTVTIKFNLTASQLGAATLRAGLTVAQAGGRPQVTVNGWTPKQFPVASSQPDSRSITLGSYRGNNTLYQTAISAGVLVAGENTLTLGVLSGSGGEGWLSPAYAYDAVDLIRTP